MLFLANSWFLDQNAAAQINQIWQILNWEDLPYSDSHTVRKLNTEEKKTMNKINRAETWGMQGNNTSSPLHYVSWFDVSHICLCERSPQERSQMCHLKIATLGWWSDQIKVRWENDWLTFWTSETISNESCLFSFLMFT